MKVWIDKIAVVVSAICIAHCLAIPVLLLLMPSALVGLHHGDVTHVVLFALAVPLSVLGMWYGYRTHSKLRYALIAVAGVGGLAVGMALHGMAVELYVTIASALILAAAHLGNKAATQRAAKV